MLVAPRRKICCIETMLLEGEVMPSLLRHIYNDWLLSKEEWANRLSSIVMHLLTFRIFNSANNTQPKIMQNSHSYAHVHLLKP
jgi:hypothetical protein